MSVSGFIARAACHGRRPTHLAAGSLNSRPVLVAQLAKSRDVARFIVAPSGYGKTYLALEYAETMKSWERTFWVNAQSPCFVRDLDDGALSSSILESDPNASLVVFDDIPLLDQQRQERFSSEIDALLHEGCEVVATCRPTCDTFGTLQHDRLCVGAKNLLLNDKELDDVRPADEKMRIPSDHLHASQRVAQLVWANDLLVGEKFAKGALSEELPADFLLVTVSALVLQKGSFSDLLSFGTLERHVLEEMAADYPHLGLGGELEGFEAPALEIGSLAGAIRKRLPRLVERSLYSTPEQLVFAWAAVLMRNGDAPRACALVQAICPNKLRATWVAANAFELVRQACLYPLFQLLSMLSVGAGDLRSRLLATEAVCRRLFGDEVGALECAKRIAFDESTPKDARVTSLITLARLNAGSVTRQANQAIAEMRGDVAADVRKGSAWDQLVEAWYMRSEGIDEMAELWLRYRDGGANDHVLCLCAAWLFDLHAELARQSQPVDSRNCRQVVRYVRNRLLEGALGDSVDFFLASAGLSMEDAHSYELEYEDGNLETASLIALRRMEMDVLSQRRYFEEGERMKDAQRQDWVATHPATFSGRETQAAAGVMERTIPLLNLKLFGTFEASVGGIPIEYARFKRQNTRALLVLLAVNQGRELSRDSVAEAMWPRSSLPVARKNFYTVWSHLRRALALPDGTCPYLIRHRYGCSLDERFVRSDVGRFNEICRELLFSSPNVERWSLLFAEIDREFSNDLMPAETSNVLITQARNEYRTRLVDALVAATSSVLDINAPQWGVWFARSAVAHDDTREDAYVALMRAQIAVKQRTSAMMTFLKCRRALSTKLGIDPSPETRSLYESLLEDDERNAGGVG